MDKLSENLLILFATFVLGFAFTVQVKSDIFEVEFITPQTVLQLENELHNYNLEVNSLKQQFENMKMKEKEYQEAKDKQGNINEIMSKQLVNIRALAGLSDLEGPGIEIVLDDSKVQPVDGNDPNLLLVHDEDLLTVVSELKAVGAEAISINGQRIMYNSEIRCGGPTINVNSVRSAPPYVIKAIGDPDVLYGYVKGPERGYLDILEYYGLQVYVRQKDKIIIPAYKGKIDLKYVKTYREGE